MEQLKCPSCKKEYTDLNPPRLLTMCGHTYCHQCLKVMIKRKDYRFQIRCPEDKLKLTLDSPTPSQFPRNMVLIQSLNKSRPKLEVSQDKNEFLLVSVGEGVNSSGKIRSSVSLKSSMFISRRTSVQEGMCLLHQKPLDIICMEERIQICAECALFGVHRGHSFTTIKDLQAKRNEWIHSISQIMEERRNVQQKLMDGVIRSQVANLLEKKKAMMEQEVGHFFAKIRETLDSCEVQLKQSIGEQIKSTEIHLNSKMNLESRAQEMFNEWEKNILGTIQYLQTEDVIKSIDFFSDLILQKDENFITKGESLINQLKGELQKHWKHIEIGLEFPKINFSHPTLQSIHKIVQIVPFPVGLQKSKEEDEMTFSKYSLEPTNHQEYETPQFEEVSLLDISTSNNNNNEHFFSIIVEPNLQRSLLMNSLIGINIDRASENVDILPKTLKKVKSKEFLLNNSFTKVNEKRNSFNSPKNRKKTELGSRGYIAAPAPSPIFAKSKIKRNIFKVKDPEKFERILKSIELDSLQNVDFTGFEMGDDLAKQVCQKLKQSSKVRSLRFMKNQLTDQCATALLDIIQNLQIINLAQNSFTNKILQGLLMLAKKQPVSKVKNIQLGQNNINPRKCKEKIQELKRYGYFISL